MWRVLQAAGMGEEDVQAFLDNQSWSGGPGLRLLHLLSLACALLSAFSCLRPPVCSPLRTRARRSTSHGWRALSQHGRALA